MTTIKLRCPRCRKKSFSATKKEDGSKLWYCYQCKYYKVTGSVATATEPTGAAAPQPRKAEGEEE